ncbi:MAG: branched-chain amino acid ABC transporter permease [Methylocystaceae bacterium]
MFDFLQQMVNGISLGAIYALIALGYTMVYGIIKLINFAHGDIMMVGSYVGLFSITLLHGNILIALIFAMVACAILGVVIERLAYRPLRGASRIAALITAIGISLFLEYVMIFFFTPQQRSFPSGVMKEISYRLFDGKLIINNRQIFIFVGTIILMILLQWIVKSTRAGKAMRAVSQDMEAATLMGVDVNRTISFTFAIGSALAAAAGVMVGVYYNSINPLMGIIPGLKAFIAAVLGGIGIIPGAMVGGFVLGILEALVSGYGNSMFRDAVAFGVLILILLIKPTGIFGRDSGEKV